MELTRYTADQWPGPPRELPALLTSTERYRCYARASNENATKEERWKAFCDLGQLVAADMRDAGYPVEVQE